MRFSVHPSTSYSLDPAATQQTDVHGLPNGEVIRSPVSNRSKIEEQRTSPIEE